MLQTSFIILLVCGACLPRLFHSLADEAESFEFFEKKIRPILVERCYECHGAEKQKGGLRLDTRASVLTGGDSGAALVPGNPEKSLLVKAVSYEDPDLQMPPKNPLPGKEIALLKEWVAAGAFDPREELSPVKANVSDASDHWAYQPPANIKPPRTRNVDWPRTEIDRFVLAAIEDRNLSPATDADAETLVRRLYHGLIGLPPTPEQIDAFLDDRSGQALERTVDRLLASPHFGERWGRHWLDVARFAESVTLRGLVFTEAWRYRDYVIQSFNRDLPYDQFLKEQLAGDLLDYSDLQEKQRARAATTYLVLGNHNYEEQDKDQLRMDIVDEQLDTIGKGLLGQTLGCARCHDHKFDPIPTRDYYAMAGILRNTRSVEHANVSAWVNVPLPLSMEEEKIHQEKESRVAELQRQIRETTELMAQAQAAGGATRNGTAVADLPGIVLDDSEAEKVGEWKLSQYNKPFVGSGYLHDDNSEKGNKTLTFHPRLESGGQYEVLLAYTHGANRASKVPVTVLHSAGESTVHVNQKVPPAIAGHFVTLGQFEFEQGNQGYVLVSNAETDGHVIVDAVQFLPVELAGTLAATKENGPGAEIQAKLEKLRRQLKSLSEAAPTRPMVMSVTEEKEIGNTYVHIRGRVHNRGEVVPRGFLQAASFRGAPAMPDEESGRRELAEWIASPNNPLAARVLVNRVWLWLFGTGIVRTPDNFGTTGALPSHPELLDFLAVRFVENGWSIKWLVREIALSRTYQLSSDADAALVLADPENLLFARGNRRRVDAETMRDAILAVSGRLDLTAGGPSIKSGTTADYGYVDTGLRRSVYVPAFRNALPQLFELFDFADTSVVTGQRNSSIVAPQALYLLNHPFMLEQSRAAAERLLTEVKTEERVEWLYRSALGRKPETHEVQLTEEHLRRIASPGFSEVDGWTELAQAVFASIDFRYLN